MTLIYKCAICKRAIKNPMINQQTCGKKECVKKYSAYLMKLLRESRKKKTAR
jgi:hypothetical protein